MYMLLHSNVNQLAAGRRQFSALSWLSILSFSLALSLSQVLVSSVVPFHRVEAVDASTGHTKIMYGSCNSLDDYVGISPFWDHLVQSKPDVFIWGGDNIYADDIELITDGRWIPRLGFVPGGLSVLEREYAKLNDIEQYKKMKLQGTEIVATWDDHDFGSNNQGKGFVLKEESRELFLKKLVNEPMDSPRWKHDGIYHAHYFDFGSQGSQTSKGGSRSVGIVLLDVRSFKDDWDKAPNGELLGEQQWKWLEAVLCDGDGYVDRTTGKLMPKGTQPRVTLIATGIQVLPQDRAVEECWKRFPQERQRLFNLLYKCQARSPVLLTGDVHFAEINVAKCHANAISTTQGEGAGLDPASAKAKAKAEAKEWPVVEITSSGMTHSFGSGQPLWVTKIPLLHLTLFWLLSAAQAIMPWNYRSQEPGAAPGYYLWLNMAEIDIDWEKQTINISIIDKGGKTAIYQAWNLDSLSPSPLSGTSTEAICEPPSGRASREQYYSSIFLLGVVVLAPYVAAVWVLGLVVRKVFASLCGRGKGGGEGDHKQKFQ